MPPASRRDPARPRRGRTPRRRRRLPVVFLASVFLLAALVGGGVAAYRAGLLDETTGPEAPAEPGPAAIPAPSGLDLPTPRAAPVVARPATTAGSLDPLAVRAALAPSLASDALGPGVAAMVAPLSGGPAAFQTGGAVAPASTMKLLTTTAALEALGGGTTFRTSVVQGPTPKTGPGTIVLVGGGDPYLAATPDASGSAYPPRADVTTLARRTATALRADGVRRVRLGYDTSLFPGPAVSPRWPADYVTDDVVAPISALWVDRGNDPSGFGNVADPPLTAASTFAAALRASGVRVVGAPQPASAPAQARELAGVDSATVDQIVQEILLVSDNEAAEVLARQVGLEVGGDGSFLGGARGVQATLRALGVPLTGALQYDGSGLSRADRLAPATLVAVLRLAASADHPELRPVLEGLPVAGFSGSLATRDGDATGAGRGMVRAKTGTLTGVSGLAGLAEGRDGSQLVFVLLADRIVVERTLDARAALDRAAAALAACACGRAP